MKNLITILIMFVAVGCGKTEVEKLTSEISSLEEETKILEAELKEEKHKLDSAAKNKKLKKSSLILSLVGSYEGKFDVNTFKYILLEKGKCEMYKNGKKRNEGAWYIEAKEVRVLADTTGIILVWKVESNGDLTMISYIIDGKRTDIPKNSLMHYKKVK